MNIGIIHNYYRSSIPSGENLTVNQIVQILRDLGHNVSVFSESSDRYENQKGIQFIRALKLIGFVQNKNFKKWISDKDAIQIHNYFPLIGKFELNTISRANIDIVRVIHNYRKTCLSGNHFRNNSDCKKCNLNNFSYGILYRCYQKSFLKSFFTSWYSKMINKFETEIKIRYVAISDAVANYLQDLHINQTRVKIISNGISRRHVIKRESREVLFVSRLEPEKGANLIFETWRQYPELPMLNIVGTGTQNQSAVELSTDFKNVKFHGLVSEEKIEEIASECRIILSPILWDEPFGRVFVEALARGQGIVTTRRGLGTSIVASGINGIFCDFSTESLSYAVTEAMKLDLDKQIATSLQIWQRKFSIDRATESWANFYSEIMLGIKND